MLGIINGILDFSKIEAGKLQLVPQLFSLHGLLDQLNSLFHDMAEKKQLKRVIESEPQVADAFFGDGMRLLQVLTNLLRIH